MLCIDKYMDIAIKEAEKSEGDIPIGCVLVDSEGEILSQTHNLKEKLKDVTAHAEMLALREASDKLNNWRLNGCSMFVTLEPCPMCAWAIINSRVENVYFGSYDNLYGGMSTKINLKEISKSKINIKGGIKEAECDMILKEYFEKIR